MNLDETFKQLGLYASNELQIIEKAKEALRIKFFALRKYEAIPSRQMQYLSIQWAIKTGYQRLNLMRFYVKLLNQLNEIESFAKKEGADLARLRKEWKKCKYEITTFESECPAIARQIQKCI